MARLYEPGDGDGSCPGEEQCPVWQSSAEDVEVRCPSCPRLVRTESGSDRVSDGGPESWTEKQLLDQVERFAQERNSGRKVYELLTPLEWELLLIRDEQIKAWEREQRTRTAMMLEALVGGLAGR